MQVSGMGGLTAFTKKGLDEHTLTFDSHKPRRSAFQQVSGAGGLAALANKGLHPPHWYLTLTSRVNQRYKN